MASQEEILVTYEDNLQVIKLNNPRRRNALTYQNYTGLVEALKEGRTRDDVVMTVLTGSGGYFTSGNDFNRITADDGDFDAASARVCNMVRKFVNELIEYPKILVAIVSGPAIGIGVTLLPLCDMIIAYDTATFQTPFASLGVCAEGCSSYTFPKYFGKALAVKMLYFGYKMTVTEALNCGFVSRVMNESELPEIMVELHKYSKLPKTALLATKELMKRHDIDRLKLANNSEIDRLIELTGSDEFKEIFVSKFVGSKSSL